MMENETHRMIANAVKDLIEKFEAASESKPATPAEREALASVATIAVGYLIDVTRQADALERIATAVETIAQASRTATAGIIR
jgi:hypothetical protein